MHIKILIQLKSGMASNLRLKPQFTIYNSQLFVFIEKNKETRYEVPNTNTTKIYAHCINC